MAIWQSTEHKYRKKITVNASQVTTSTTDFINRIKINDYANFAFYTNHDASDVLFIDEGGNVLTSKVVLFDQKKGYAIFDVKSNISNSVDKVFYMYFGSDTYTNPQINVYTPQIFVKDFTEQTSEEVSTDLIPSKTPSPQNLVYNGTGVISEADIAERQDTLLGYALNFDNNDVLEVGNIQFANNEVETLVMEAWVNLDEISNETIFDSSFSTNPIESDFALRVQSNKITAEIRTDQAISATRRGNTDVPIGSWAHVAFHWSASTNILTFLLNGVEDGTHIVNGNYIQTYYANLYPQLQATIAGAQNLGGFQANHLNGRISQIRVSTDSSYNIEAIKNTYKAYTNIAFYTQDSTEANPSNFYDETLKWKTDYFNWESRLKVNIKSSEFIGSENLTRFPFLLNLYSPCLNEASPYANDIIVTDKNSERLPFERFAYNQNINQIRFGSAYKVELGGVARLVEDTNADGNYRVGYLSGAGNYVRFNDVSIFNEGTQTLRIRYSNGGAATTTDINVNGVSQNVTFPSTSSWSIYDTIEIQADFVYGQTNFVEIGANLSSADIDWIQVDGQESTQLKGFVLLSDVIPGEDYELNIYYKNPSAPIRLNPAYGQPDTILQAENMTIVEGFDIETNSSFSDGSGLSLYHTPYPSYGEAEQVFSGVSGWYDLLSEVITENDGDNNYELEINGTQIDSWLDDAANAATSFQMQKHLTRKVWLNTNDVITIKGYGNETNTWARFGQIGISYSVIDPNPNWNSEEVWEDYEAVWHLNEEPGHGVAFADVSGNKRHLTAYNMAAINDIDSSIGTGIKFINPDDLLHGSFDAMNLSDDDFTISLWQQRTDANLNNKEGILVSDNLNIRFDNNDELKFKFGDETKATDNVFLDDDFFNKSTFVFDASTQTRYIRNNGVTLATDIDGNNISGLNDSITIGRREDEDELSIGTAEPFQGSMAEIRIKKNVQSQLNDANEYKNIIYPQQYITYTDVVCQDNVRDFDYETETTGLIETSGINDYGTFIIERIRTVTAETNSENSLGLLEFERDSVGGVIVSGNDIQTEFVIARDNPVLISSQTGTIAGINYVIEFVRQFTGGILSGGAVSESDEVSFIPDTTGSLSLGKIDTSHVINNGFTLNVYFEDVIGGRVLSGGAIVNNIARYINVVSGGITYVKESGDIIEAIYNEIENTGSILSSGDVDIENHSVYYLDPSDYALVIISYPTEVIHKVIYANSYYGGSASISGTVQTNNINIFIPDIEVSGIGFVSGDVDIENHSIIYNDSNYNGNINVYGYVTESDDNTYTTETESAVGNFTGTPNRYNIYKEIENGGSISIGVTAQDDNENIFIPDVEVSGIGYVSGNVDLNNHVVYYLDPSDFVYTTITSNFSQENTFIPDTEVSGEIVISGNVDYGYHQAFYFDPSDVAIGNFSYSSEVIHTIEYYPIHLQLITINGEYDESDFINYVLNTYGSIKWGKINTTQEITDEWTNILVFTDNGGVAISGGTALYDIEVNFATIEEVGGSAFTSGTSNDTTKEVIYIPDEEVDGSGYTSGTVQTNNINIFIPDVEVGGVAFSSGFGGEYEVEVAYINDYAKITLSGIEELSILDYTPISTIVIKNIISDTIIEANYNSTLITNTILTSYENEFFVEYENVPNFASVTIDIDNTHSINFITDETTIQILTAGSPEYFFGYYPIVTGAIKTSSTGINFVEYVEDFNAGTIITKIISVPDNKREIEYIPESFGVITLSGGSSRDITFDFTEIYGNIVLSGEVADKSLHCYVENDLMLRFIGTRDSEEVQYYNSNYGGLATTASSAAVVVINTSIYNTDWCVKGRVDILDNIPLPAVSSLWDIWYVSSTDSWWQLRLSGNYEQIANPFYNSGVLGVYNSIADLPTTGNSIGDVWQIGSCLDAEFYVWDGSDWIEDTNYPSILIAYTGSAYKLKTKGTASKEVNYITDEEVSGNILLIDKFKTTINYNSTLIKNDIKISGGYLTSSFKLIAKYISSGSFVLTSEETIPSITRINEESVKLIASGVAGKEVEYYIEEREVVSVFAGIGVEVVSYKPYVDKATLITPSGDVSRPDKVIFKIDSPTIGYFNGSADADSVSFDTSILYNSNSIKITDGSDVHVDYYDSSETIELNLSIHFERNILFYISNTLYLESYGSSPTDDVNYIDTKTSFVKINEINTIEETEYIIESTTGSIKWGKVSTASISVETDDSLIVSYQPSGRVNLSNYYFNVKVNYINIEIGIDISTTISSSTSIDITNPAYDFGSIITFGNRPADKVIYEIRDFDITTLTISSNTEHIIEYASSNEVVYLVFENNTDHIVEYEDVVNVTPILLSGIVDDFDYVDLTINIQNKKIILSGVVDVVADRIVNENTTIAEIYTSSSGEELVSYRINVETPKYVIASGIATPNELYVSKRIVPAKIILSGTSSEFDIYIEEGFGNIYTSGSSIDKSVYEPDCQSASLNVNNTITYHYFEIVRELLCNVEVSGEIDYNHSYQVYRWITSGGIITSGDADTEYTRIFSKNYYVVGKIILSGNNTEYSNYRDYVYEYISGGINVHGDYLDPVEFYQTYTGIVNVFGSAKTRLLYGHEIEIGIIKVTVFDPDNTEYSEYNKYPYEVRVSKIRVSGSATEYFYKPSFSGYETTVSLKLISFTETEYYPIFDVSGFGYVLLRSSGEYETSYDHISTQDIPEIIVSGTEHNYEQTYYGDDYAEVIVSGDDITLEEFEANYVPENGGIVWGKGTIVDPTDFNVFITDNVVGAIILGGSAGTEYSRDFYGEMTFAYLGSIKIWGSATYHPSSTYNTDNASVVVSGESLFKIGYNSIPTYRKIRVSGTSIKYVEVFGLTIGKIIVSGESYSYSEYNYETIGGITTSGSGIGQIVVEREVNGLIDVNVNSNRNIDLEPIVEGWIRIRGGIDNASVDFVDYGELDTETAIIVVTPNSLYRTNEDSDLIFHEITNRRDFEAALSDDLITYPEEVWSTLQNFNDLINDEE